MRHFGFPLVGSNDCGFSCFVEVAKEPYLLLNLFLIDPTMKSFVTRYRFLESRFLNSIQRNRVYSSLICLLFSKQLFSSSAKCLKLNADCNRLKPTRYFLD